MATAATTQLTESVEQLKETGDYALENPTVEDFIDIERRLSGIESHLREMQQSMWAREVKQTIKRLDRDEPLTETDRDVIRTFLISDAEHYLAQENNYRDWLGEFRRLLDEVSRRVNTVDQFSIGELRGILKDAIRLVPDIRNYLEERRRVERFDLTQGSLDPQARETLARILREQISSPSR